MWHELSLAAIREVPKLATGIVLLWLVWRVGNRFTIEWNLRQKERELDLIAAGEFHSIYGEFFATWKLWNCYLRDVGPIELFGGSRWELLKRASDAEGRLEAMFVRLASSQKLKQGEIEKLGLFRQLYQRLRESIRANAPLEWESSAEPEYIEFKAIAPQIASLIRRGGTLEIPAGSAATLKQITDNRFELPRGVVVRTEEGVVQG